MRRSLGEKHEKILEVINSNAKLKQEIQYNITDLEEFCRETDFSELKRIRELSPRKHRRTPSSVNDELLEPPPETGMSQQAKRNWTKEELDKLSSLVEAEGPGMWAQKAASPGNAASLCLSALLCALTTHSGCRNRANGGCAPIALAG